MPAQKMLLTVIYHWSHTIVQLSPKSQVVSALSSVWTMWLCKTIDIAYLTIDTSVHTKILIRVLHKWRCFEDYMAKQCNNTPTLSYAGLTISVLSGSGNVWSWYLILFEPAVYLSFARTLFSAGITEPRNCQAVVFSFRFDPIAIIMRWPAITESK